MSSFFDELKAIKSAVKTKKLRVSGGVYDEDVVAFVKKLAKPIKRSDQSEKAYVMQMKHGYSFDAAGKKRSVFLTKEEGEALIEELMEDHE